VKKRQNLNPISQRVSLLDFSPIPLKEGETIMQIGDESNLKSLMKDLQSNFKPSQASSFSNETDLNMKLRQLMEENSHTLTDYFANMRNNNDQIREHVYRLKSEKKNSKSESSFTNPPSRSQKKSPKFNEEPVSSREIIRFQSEKSKKNGIQNPQRP
jgi:hypothetical protein